MRILTLAIGSLLLLAGCKGEGGETADDWTADSGWGVVTDDDDGDGYVATDDCDDTDATVHPGADEVCDDQDNDCDGETDEDATDATTWYADIDGDGYGDGTATTSACDQPSAHVADATDCDDADATIHPGADEVCDDLDSDCDDVVDEDATDAMTWYGDGDGDGYGDEADTEVSCEAPSGYVADAGDCDDDDDAFHPDATEDDCTDPADYNCDGSVGYADEDGDSFPACEDCDDGDAAVNADASEVCDEVDNDCDGLVDDDDDSLDAASGSTWYADADGDDHGDGGDATDACEAPSGTVANDDDCDDTSATTYPGAAPADSVVDCMNDDDGDGYGDETASPGVTAGTDCDDDDGTLRPDATELCDGLDNDCDDLVDDDDDSVADQGTWFADADGDGYGDAADATDACDQPLGTTTDATDCDDEVATTHPGAAEVEGSFDCTADADDDGWADADPGDPSVTAGTDCDDADADVNPDADEVCDGIDNDCDALTDDDDDSLDPSDGGTYYADDDGDGFGNPEISAQRCEAGLGEVEDASDCDDFDGDVHPDATEICDDLDNDCDDAIDDADDDLDGSTGSSSYEDADGDGYGDPDSSVQTCEPPDGYVAGDEDCDDDDGDVHPGALEICDDVDNDCNGLADDDDPTVDLASADTFYADADGDDHGDDDDAGTRACDQPDGYADAAEDCDDTDPDVHPDASEVCDDLDNDCDGLVDDDDDDLDASDGVAVYLDADGDGYGDQDGQASRVCEVPSGYAANGTDCDDDDDGIHPAATEVCDDDDIDEDCDGLADDDDGSVSTASKTSWYDDVDGDGYGSTTDPGTLACDQPTGTADEKTDCDDTDADLNPGATEVCDDVDNDCDGQLDELDADLDTSTTTAYYLDGDGDGHGDDASETLACDSPGGAWITDGGDCDDDDADVHPDADDVCDDVDVNCDGVVGDPGSLGIDLGAGAVDYSGVTGSISLTSDATVYVCEGTFDVALTVSGAATVEVVGLGSDLSTIDGGTDGDAVAADGAELVVSGVTLTGDGGTCTVSAGTSTYGGGACCTDGGSLELSEVAITGVTSDGGPLYVEDGCIATVADSLISENAVTQRGGAVTVFEGWVELTDSELSDNIAAQFGGAIYANGLDGSSIVTMTDTVVRDNVATSSGGGGAFLNSGGELACYGTAGVEGGFFGNSANTGGGAVQLYDGSGSSTSSFTAEVCDFGASGTSDDNDPDDVGGGVTSTPDWGDSFGDDVTLVCDASTCLGGGGDTGDTGTPDTAGSYTYSFADDVQPILTANCTDYGCHQSTMCVGNGGYSEGMAYGCAVDYPSTDIPSMDRIEPGDAENSYLYRKLAGTHAEVGGDGSQMPLGFSAVSSSDLAILETWIDEGAPDN